MPRGSFVHSLSTSFKVQIFSRDRLPAGSSLPIQPANEDLGRILAGGHASQEGNLQSLLGKTMLFSWSSLV